MGEPEQDTGSEQAELYRRYVCQAKQEARNGNVEESVRLFRQAHEICPSEKLMNRVQKLQNVLASMALDQEDNGFVDVCESGLMLFGEMHDKLFDYQREGVSFLYSCYQDGRKGSVLADDMGLGKTIQIIAFLSGMFDASLIQSVLLIMPTTLVSNWMKEFASWTPGMRVKVFHGISKAERNRNLERIQRRSGILLTTYQMVLNNWQQLSSCGGKEFVWDYIILDEAHKIKSPSAKTTKSVYAIPSKNRILLTGTPVQNNLKELWTLFDYACQGSLLGTSKTFKMEYENPITRGRAKDATPGEKALGLKISENLMSIIKPYFLRRSKCEIQNKLKPQLRSTLPEDKSKDDAPAMPSLPRKNDFIVWVYLARIQEEIYRNFLSLDHIKELLMTTRSPLAELSVLKKLCDHPRLLSSRACSHLGLEASDYSEPSGGENDTDGLLGVDRNIENIPTEVLIEESGKLCFLVALLERLQDEGHKTLVFSQSRKMLDIIECILTLRCFKIMRIDGTVTDLVEREKRICLFQTDSGYSVFLLTTQVGGVGLTLTAATRVVIFDPSWNPATDAQAVDRVYRIGQKENVVIYRLITCGTVEEKIYRRQVFKDSLIRQTTGDKKNPYRYFTMQELRELFTLEDTRSSVTQLQLQSLHATQRKTDCLLDEHIAYLYSLEIFGISDHDLMYTQEAVHEEEPENEEAHRYIEHRVQKAQELVQLESQLRDRLMENITNTTEGTWLKEGESSTQPRKKSPKPQPNHLLSPLGNVELTNKEDIVNLIAEDDDSVMNISSKLTSLVIGDTDDKQIFQNISNMETSFSKDESHHQARIRDLSTRSSFPHARSLSNKENCSPESKIIYHDSPADANSELKDVEMISLQQSFACNDEHKPQNKTEMLFSVPSSPHVEAGKNDELDAATAFKLQASNMPHCTSPESEILPGNESLAGSSLYQDAFKLVLEDSEDGVQSVLESGMPLEDTENSGLQLRLDSNCSSVACFQTGENGSNRRLQASESISSLIMGDSGAACNALIDISDVCLGHKKKPLRRIISDDEEEEGDNVIIDLDESEHQKVSPLKNPNKICMSTPKSSNFRDNPCFSPVRISRRRSTASRRSFANIVLDQVEDMLETMEVASYVYKARSCENDLERELSQDYMPISQESALETEEESSGAVLGSKSTLSHYNADSSADVSASSQRVEI